MGAAAKSDISLQERDLALLRGLFECRVMSSEHVATLYFNGKAEATKKRLQKLKAAGFIKERPRRSFEPSVLFLSRKGLNLLQDKGVLKEYPSFDLPALEKRAQVKDLTIRHELEVMDVKTAFHLAIRAFPALHVAEFSTWPMLNEFIAYRPGFNTTEVLVKPDGFIRIHETEVNDKFEHTFFLEVDRSTEVQEVLLSRAGCYYDYYKSGGFAVRNRARREDYKQFPFRVLMVFKTAERRNNTAEKLLQMNLPMFKQVCLSTLEEVASNPLGAIWVQPLDYRNATQGTEFDTSRKQETWGYKRQTAREIFVAKNVTKVRILTGESATPAPPQQSEPDRGLARV